MGPRTWAIVTLVRAVVTGFRFRLHVTLVLLYIFVVTLQGCLNSAGELAGKRCSTNDQCEKGPCEQCSMNDDQCESGRCEKCSDYTSQGECFVYTEFKICEWISDENRCQFMAPCDTYTTQPECKGPRCGWDGKTCRAQCYNANDDEQCEENGGINSTFSHTQFCEMLGSVCQKSCGLCEEEEVLAVQEGVHATKFAQETRQFNRIGNMALFMIICCFVMLVLALATVASKRQHKQPLSERLLSVA